MDYYLPVFVGVIALVSVILAPKAESAGAFFRGLSATGRQPGLITLIFSQVTTWIFARSLMNAAILGFYYGIWGTLAYAFYYFSFLTGGRIVDSLRFEHGFNSVQEFLRDRFGPWGTSCYNFVIGIRLISEVFANLLVIGILFGVAGSNAYTLTILGFSAITLFYSMLGGLRASMRTDVFQMTIFIGTLLLLIVLVTFSHSVNLTDLWFKPFVFDQPGPVLMLVALLQIWSYPMHDPVMMDRGFLADRETTRKSFLHAAWISIVCIISFGCLGVLAGAHAVEGATMNETLMQLLGTVPMMLFNAALVISAMSTLDSTLSSSAKLIASDMGVVKTTLRNGRLVMVIFMFLGLLLVFWGNKDLFSAVAVSGTVSMYLAPVIFFSLWGKRRDIPVWSYLLSFALAIIGAALYFTESSGHSVLLGDIHKYTKLLYICIVVLVGGCFSFWIGGTAVSTENIEIKQMNQTKVNNIGRLDGSVLIFGGAYSNLAATTALRNEAEKLGIPPERIICTGDLVAYCAEPELTVQLIRDWGVHVVMGNCEKSLAERAVDCGCGFTEGNTCAALSVDWYHYADSKISAQDRVWMSELPYQLVFELAGQKLTVIHGGVTQLNRFLFASSPEAEKQLELAALADDIRGVIAGHCGIPFGQTVGGKVWLNAGAVGMPANDGTQDGWYMLLEHAGEQLQARWCRLAYPCKETWLSMHKAGLKSDYSEAIMGGLWPSDDVLPATEKKLRGTLLTLEPLTF